MRGVRCTGFRESLLQPGLLGPRLKGIVCTEEEPEGSSSSLLVAIVPSNRHQAFLTTAAVKSRRFGPAAPSVGVLRTVRIKHQRTLRGVVVVAFQERGTSEPPI